ncbi:MAG: hypothetical protein GKS06_00645 [Acidobacteria bacterium]|nr:hypothetical protein [Acidobacteriota bacterium]
MPTNKDLKRVVRERMSKTGESYTAARARVVAKHGAERADAFAAEAGMSDDAVFAKTGGTWADWVDALDAFGGMQRPRREIVDHLQNDHEVAPWWAQTVTVGYERIRGLRQKTQRRDGTFEANKSKTFPVPIAALYRAFFDDAERGIWLETKPTMRTCKELVSVRMLWPDDTQVQAYFTDRGDRASVQVQHVKLPDKEAVARVKEDWARRFEALAAHLHKSD